MLTWRAVPVMPVEIMLLPKWFPFHLDKISYWARTVIVPLHGADGAEAARAKSAAASASTNCSCRTAAAIGLTAKAPHQSRGCSGCSARIDVVLRAIEPLFPKKLRARAIDSAVAFVDERLNGEDGLGAIYPGDGQHRDDVRRARQSAGPSAARDHARGHREAAGDRRARGLLPALRLAGVGHRAGLPRAARDRRRARRWRRLSKGLEWLQPKQVLDVKGDWAVRRPDVRPGGWAFQYDNAHYPDLDDTAVVVMAMDRARRADRQPANTTRRSRARANGSRACRAATAAGPRSTPTIEYYLNNIPFSDHGALLDPPTEDVTARCVSMLAQLGETARDQQAVADGVDYLRRTQLADGTWYGRWGMNYIYGTWSVLCALNAAGVDHHDPVMRKAVDWLIVDPERGRRLGRGCGQLQARLSRLRGRAEHRFADRLGVAWADGGRRGRTIRRWRAACSI